MRTTIRKWGNSLGVRIPSALAEDARLHDGTEVDVTFRDGQLVIIPVLSLAELVAGITSANLPDLADTGVPRGGEQW
ncbi:MAG: AbrB/MazE/SpoVT family DNA-binding domain-containing protein [Gemmatimonadaceae bacterium]|nr:AbrB/MazE/SpoVT family DNA-binding domain-containing protein [Gemmatimonadaceae bacterium]